MTPHDAAELETFRLWLRTVGPRDGGEKERARALIESDPVRWLTWLGITDTEYGRLTLLRGLARSLRLHLADRVSEGQPDTTVLVARQALFSTSLDPVSVALLISLDPEAQEWFARGMEAAGALLDDLTDVATNVTGVWTLEGVTDSATVEPPA